MSKYKNKKIVINGITFDSKKEGNYYLYLKELVKRGEISELKTQVKFELIPKFKIGNKTERSTTYLADFSYIKDGVLHVVDVKSPITRKNPLYRIKKKLFEYKYQIELEEV